MKFEKKENVVYSVKGDTENALIETNKPYLGIVLNQLLMNAGKFTNEGFITIGYTIDKNNAQAEIYVADSGSGIPSEKRDWVFEKIHERERIQERYRHRTLPLPADRHPSERHHLCRSELYRWNTPRHHTAYEAALVNA
jgi:K+-sensing histidine kinase KdpD